MHAAHQLSPFYSRCRKNMLVHDTITRHVNTPCQVWLPCPVLDTGQLQHRGRLQSSMFWMQQMCMAVAALEHAVLCQVQVGTPQLKPTLLLHP